MNPTAGSFFVNPRLQRHFWLLAVQFPEQSSLQTIYSAFLNKHYSKFKSSIMEIVSPVIKAAINLHNQVDANFRKTAANFHYEFNVRHLTNIFQGLLAAKPEAIKEPENFVKLWFHESERIYGDRLVDAANLAAYRELASDIVKKGFLKYNMTKYISPANEPLIFAHFVGSLDDKLYDQFPNTQALTQRLHEALNEYNEVNPVMDLVLFEDAMKHVCRISRIISNDSGHALLVGVGGSGKQSLSRLSSFISQYSTVSIMISSTYGLGDLKTDLQNYYMKSGVKDEGLMFLFTEGQITNERFLVFINDLLSSGEISDLFPIEDVDNIVNSIRPAVKGEGIVDSKDNCWKFFIDRVKKNLHMALCFSPVGESFRSRARKFPALINCTVIDWFHPWPEQALLNVASKFLKDVPMPSDDVRDAVERFMPYSFKIVGIYSSKILEQERRYVYTTPKSFLELIKLFQVMLGKKQKELEESKEKYQAGVVKLTETGEAVNKIEEELKVFSVEVEAKKKVADEQAAVVGVEKEKVEEQNNIATVEADKCAIIAKEVAEKSAKVQADLDAAIPLVEKAEVALSCLNVKDFQTLKVMGSPPEAVSRVFTCVLHLLSKINEDVPVDNKGKLKHDQPWKVAQKLMQNPGAFLNILIGFKALVDEDKVPANNFKNIRSYLADEEFTPEIIRIKSSLTGNICAWIINITAYYDVVVSVEPKKQAVREATETLEAANTKKAQMDELVAKLNADLKVL